MIISKAYQPARSPQILLGEANTVPRFPIDARVLEEDTYLVLSAEPRPREVRQRPRRLLREAKESLPITPGSVVVRPTQDVTELIAVVHDLELDPSCIEAWVELALKNILAEADRSSWATLAMPMLGTHHGALPVHRSASLLRDVLADSPPIGVTRIWLEVPRKTVWSALAPLKPWIH